MKSFDKQVKDLMKNIQKHLNKEVEKETMKLQTQNQAFLLDTECEELLLEILANDTNFPAVLRNKFFNADGSEISYNEDQKLRAKIHELVINGLITLRWGDNVPILGRIEQKGRSYFEMKEKYKQLYYGESEMQFKYLDQASEEVLKELLNNKDFYNCPCFIVPSSYPASIIENLIKLGYLESKQGVQYFLGGEGYVCAARLTQSAKSYEEMKEKYSSMNKNQVNNYYAPVNDFSGANIENSVLQVGNVNSTQEIEITTEKINEAIQEINKNIETYGLSDTNKQELKDLLEDLDEKNKKKPNLVMRALKGIWGFAKDVGCGLLTAYLTMKFGFNC